MTRAENLSLLAFRCEQMRLYPDDARFCEWSEKAVALARELFPPSAKPLAWNEDFETACAWTDESKITGYHVDCREPGKWRAQYRKGNPLEMLGRAFPTRDAAKAFCEAHHQSRFQELLA